MAANKAGPGAIGLRLLNFSRVRIQHYVPAPNFTSRAELPRSWQEATEEPLVWKVSEPEAVPISETPIFEEAPQPEQKQEGFPKDLVKILEMHQARQATEQAAPQTEAVPTKPSPSQVARQEASRPQIARKEAPRPQPARQQASVEPRPKAVQRQPASQPQTAPTRPPDKTKPGLLEEVTPTQLPAVESNVIPEPDSWMDEKGVSEDTPVIPLDLEIDDSDPVLEKAPIDDSGWLPTHAIPDVQQSTSVQPETAKPVSREVVKPAPVQPAKPAARPEGVQRTAERPVAPTAQEHPKVQPPANVQSPLVSAIVGEPEPENIAPTNYSLPLLDDDEFQKDTERVEYVSPDEDSSILLNTTEARVSRLDSIHRSLEAVQRNLDSIQRFVGPPDDSPQTDNAVVENSAEDAASPDQPDVVDDMQDFWHSPEPPAANTPPTESPAVQRAEYQPATPPSIQRTEHQPPESPRNPATEQPPSPWTWSQDASTPDQSTTTEPPDEPSMQLPYELPLTEPGLPEESSDLVIALQSAETAMPIASEMRDFEPSVWTTPEAPPNEVQQTPQLISRTPESKSAPSANGIVEHGDSPANSNIAAPDVSDTDNAVAPLNGATADLLKLLDLPPDTPVIGMNSSPAVVRRATNGQQEYFEAEDEPSSNPINDVPLDVALMGGSVQQPIMRDREVSVSGNNDNNSQNNGDHHGGNGASGDVPEADQNSEGPNIEKLARDVHRILRERLRIEQERRTDR